MKSFQKFSDSQVTINGTKLKNNLAYISTGIPSLDHVVGGGIPVGSIFGIEEDALNIYSRIFIKYFLSEGVACKHDLFLSSADENPQDIVKQLPLPCTQPMEEENNPISSGADKMKIAWRYEGLGQVESSFGSSTSFGHHFDLSKSVDEETIKAINITYCDLTLNGGHEVCNDFRNGLFYQLLSDIKKAVSKEEYSVKNKNGNILRISVQSLGSPVWLGMECGDEATSQYALDLMKFLYSLRVILRDKNAVALVTIPSHLFEDDHVMKRLLYTIDNAVRIESFAGSSKETNPVYKDYHGLFHITKLSALYSIVPFVPPSLDLAFKLKRKKFLIEKLHLPPELQETSEREQDDITATPTVNCGSFKKKDIDF